MKKFIICCLSPFLSENFFGLTNKFGNNFIPAFKALSTWFAVGHKTFIATGTLVALLSAHAFDALALAGPRFANLGSVSTRGIAVARLAISDSGISVVTLFASRTIPPAESRLTVTLPVLLEIIYKYMSYIFTLKQKHNDTECGIFWQILVGRKYTEYCIPYKLYV